MATESGEPSDINRVLAFIEGFHEGKTAMDEVELIAHAAMLPGTRKGHRALHGPAGRDR